LLLLSQLASFWNFASGPPAGPLGFGQL